MTVANLMHINWELVLVLKEVFVKWYGDVNIQSNSKTKAAENSMCASPIDLMELSLLNVSCA